MYQKCLITHRKEYMRWITEAKNQKPERNRKVKLIEMILAGKKEYNLNINAYEIKKLFHWTVIAPILAWFIYF